MQKNTQAIKETPLRNVFMRAFVRELMKNILPEETPENKKSIEVTLTKSEPEMRVSLATPIEKVNPPLILPKRKIISQSFRPLTPQRNLVQRFFRPSQKQAMFPPQPKPMRLEPLPEQNPATQIKEKINFGKISQVLSDPAVLSVEVPGPGKFVLANRSGRVEMTNLTLTKEEIDSIIKEISEKTKIPVLPGIFKTALPDMLLTAVVSDFVGTRFVIQKRNQFNNPLQQNNPGFNNHSNWQG